jgi:hypothetical protein
VVITTKDSKQLEQQLYPAFERFRGRLARWKWSTSSYTEIESPVGGRIVAFTTNDAGRAEGWHKEDDRLGPLLIIVDEAKSVEEPIFQAIDRCTFNALLYVSSPGLMMGTFYNAFHKSAALFHKRKVGLSECPHIPPERVDGVIAKYGREHPLVQSSVFGEFMDQDEATAFVFPLKAVQAALANPPRFRGGDQNAFCDFAGGGDENVLAIRTGNRVEIAAAWRDKDTMKAVSRFILEFRKAGLSADQIFADAGGLGHPMTDALWQHGWEINRVNNGARPHDPIYENRGAEMWHETAAALRRSELILPPGDDDLIAQLTTRKARVTSECRLGLESKDDLRKRGLPSPDRADALCGAWCSRSLIPTAHSHFFDDHASPSSPELVLAGMHAG